MNTRVDNSREPAGGVGGGGGGGNLPQFHHFQKAFGDLQQCCSALAHNLTHLPLFAPNPSSLKTHLHNALSSLQSHRDAVLELDAGNTNLFPNSRSSSDSQRNPAWARIAETYRGFGRPPRPMSAEAIEERLAGVPVYALSNAAEEFVLVSGASTGRNLGLFCFKKEDAETLLEHLTVIDPQMREGSRVVPVALNKVFQLKVNGVAFRFIPEYSQIKNALGEREKSGSSSDGFPGVPVFQSKSLILRSQNKTYRPLFFRKEDLEKSLQKAARQQNRLNPALRRGDIQVAVLEDVIKEMKENSASNWDDVIFIPPGFDVSSDPDQQ